MNVLNMPFRKQATIRIREYYKLHVEGCHSGKKMIEGETLPERK